MLDLADRPAVSAVRGWTTDAVPGVSGELLEDLLLVVTELVSNAYDHSGHPLRLRLSTRAGGVRVEVEDASAEPPVLGRSRISETRGRGLVLVAALALAWGHSVHDTGKTVWADLAEGA